MDIQLGNDSEDELLMECCWRFGANFGTEFQERSKKVWWQNVGMKEFGLARDGAVRSTSYP